MKLMKFTFLCVFLSALLSVAYPYRDSCPIPLGEGEVKAGSDFKLDLSKLPAGIIFDIECDIINANFDKKYPIIMQIGATSAPFTVFLNDKIFDCQGKLDRLNNKMIVSKWSLPHVGSQEGVYFKNLDAIDNAIVTHCVAVYHS